MRIWEIPDIKHPKQVIKSAINHVTGHGKIIGGCPVRNIKDGIHWEI
jgi:hypothetical protein